MAKGEYFTKCCTKHFHMISIFCRVLDESRKIDVYLNERDKDHSNLIKNLANEVDKLYFII
jgi:hypothetical protein